MITRPLDEYEAKEQQRIVDYLTREEKVKVTIWTCCGGIELHEEDKCPICGEVY